MAAPQAAPRPWPTWRGPVGLTDTNSTWTRLPACLRERPQGVSEPTIPVAMRWNAPSAILKLMNPGPATDVDSTSVAAGSAATIFAARSRGLQRAARASPSATGHAKSPCRGSRVRSITIGGTDPASSSPRARSVPMALATSASSPRFKDCFRR